MPILPQQTSAFPETSAVSLAMYARAIQVCECQFFGVKNGPDCTATGCKSIWTKEERDWVEFYLAEAQWEIENIIHYPIGLRWITNERHTIKHPILTNWGYVVNGGTQAETTIAASAAVNHLTDPATVGPLATTVTDPDEIVVFHPGTEHAIDPSSVTINSGFVTITIPRCRMVKPEYMDNPAAGINYSDLDYFAEYVDVKRIYNYNNNPATLLRQSCLSNCGEVTGTTCLYVQKGVIGQVALGDNCSICCAEWADLNYYAGRPLIIDGQYTRFGRQAQDAIIRLAHVKMPHAPCDCDPVTNLWKRDRNVLVDTIGRALRGTTPFGVEEGAWTAWRFATSPGMRLRKAAVL